MKSRIFSSLKLFSLALLIGLGTSYVFAWTGPTTAPTGGNTPAPINVSSASQTKSGSLRVAGVRTSLASYINFASSADLTAAPYGTTAFNALALAINGKVGATHYCDELGNNCLTVTQMASSTGSGTGGSVCKVGVQSVSQSSLGNTTSSVSTGINSATYTIASAVMTGGDYSKGWRVETENSGGVWKVKFSRVGDTSQTIGPLYADLIYSNCL